MTAYDIDAVNEKCSYLYCWIKTSLIYSAKIENRLLHAYNICLAL